MNSNFSNGLLHIDSMHAPKDFIFTNLSITNSTSLGTPMFLF